VVAADHPERVETEAFIAPAVPLAPALPERTFYAFDDPLYTTEGWAKYNRHYWLEDYPGFLEFFLGKIFTEPHSTKQIEDGIGWALDTTPEALIASEYGLLLCRLGRFRETCERARCPVLV